MLEDLQLDLDVYQGPFDLLFSLILREEVDILEVAVLDVILAYLERQAKQDDANWESASEFLVLVSSLLELKSRVLLPKQETGEGDMDPGEARERLLERLVSYARFKKAAEALAARRLAERYHWLRPPERRPERRLSPLKDISETEEPERLASAMRNLLISRRQPDTSHLSRAKVTVAQRISVVRRLLAAKGSLSFDAAFGREEPLVQALTLLAILDLMAGSQVSAEQKDLFGDICVRSEGANAAVQA